MPRLKHNNANYDQVQDSLGITKAKWCDFVVYTNKTMCLEHLTLNERNGSELKH
jgi:hypothetical protein